MGKAHTCVLTKSGEVWTFGVNNKGQCGRDTGAMTQTGKGEKMYNHKTALIILRLRFMSIDTTFLYNFCVYGWYSVRCGEHGHSHG